MLLLPDTTRPEVKECGGPVQLASLLTPEKISDPAWLTVCADAIRMTAYEDAETKVGSLVYSNSCFFDCGNT